MPELPEAETLARELAPELFGRVVHSVSVARTDILHDCSAPLHELLVGRCVAGVSRRGKRVILAFDPPLELVIRLGMSGQINVVPQTQPLETHTHVRIAFRQSLNEVRFRDPRRFGGIWIRQLPNSALPRRESTDGQSESELGPEPLEISRSDFRRLLRRRKQIKALLMDQRILAGMGNIYCDESLHAAAIHPLRIAGELSAVEADRLWRRIRATLRSAIRFNGSTLMDYRRTDGREGSFQARHRVYQRAGKSCNYCDTLIMRITAAGRSTFLCPRCQPVC